MALFTAKVDYALRALLDLTMQPPGRAAQSREIAARQRIPESYLNQLLVTLRRAGLVRSVRGAAGGYVLGREPAQLTVADVVEALHGSSFLGGSGGQSVDAPVGWVVRQLGERVEGVVRNELTSTTLADLQAEVERQNEAQSLMQGL